MWILIDNLEPNRPCAVNLNNTDAISWDKGTLSFDFAQGSIQVEASKEEFIKICSQLDFKYEME